jgi:hypothetical protein
MFQKECENNFITSKLSINAEIYPKKKKKKRISVRQLIEEINYLQYRYMFL